MFSFKKREDEKIVTSNHKFTYDTCFDIQKTFHVLQGTKLKEGKYYRIGGEPILRCEEYELQFERKTGHARKVLSNKRINTYYLYNTAPFQKDWSCNF